MQYHISYSALKHGPLWKLPGQRQIKHHYHCCHHPHRYRYLIIVIVTFFVILQPFNPSELQHLISPYNITSNSPLRSQEENDTNQ